MRRSAKKARLRSAIEEDAMKVMNCPLNGPRNISEFAWGGEVKPMPDPASLDDRAWGDWLFLENNEAGVVREWWCHVPTSFWFIAERNTVTDEILKTYPASELFKDRVNFAARAKTPAAEKK
jgi:sarcosine oxidase, subunit delta